MRFLTNVRNDKEEKTLWLNISSHEFALMDLEMEKKGKILVVDDNEDVLFALHALLSSVVEEIKVITKPQNIERFIKEFQPDIILLDMNFERDAISGEEGFYWLSKIKGLDSNVTVLLMTAYADTEKAVKAIKAGATDFISKPWQKDKLLATINSALELKKSKEKLSVMREQISDINMSTTDEIIGNSPVMNKVFEIVELLSDTDANVLILGENGTGKDLIAQTIHNNSPRKSDVFAHIDLGSISENLFESELFGYEKGAFTDAKQTKKGKMELASGGTLFLNEIGNLPLPMQAKLLTVVEKKILSRLGSTENKKIDVRYICATNSDIYQAVNKGVFRQDLLYRINTIEIYIPPLRERGNDIILLAEHFLDKYCRKYQKSGYKLTLEIKNKLLSYQWLGNVRELQNVMERAVVLSTSANMLNRNIILRPNESSISNEELNLDVLEQNAIDKAMLRSDGNVTQAAKILGISRYSLHRKLNK